MVTMIAAERLWVGDAVEYGDDGKVYRAVPRIGSRRWWTFPVNAQPGEVIDLGFIFIEMGYDESGAYKSHPMGDISVPTQRIPGAKT